MEHCLGRRLSLKDQLCTVRYVGTVQGKAGTWLGVEWDDAARGKHDGTHDGVRYFHCRSSSSTAASFLRPNQPWDPPRSFYRALREKYMHEEAGSGGEMVYFSTKQAEEVGFEKFAHRQAALHGIKTIVLDHMRISCKDLHAEKDLVSDTCKEIMDLDISSNLFETLDEILGLLALFPKLRSVVLDGNRIHVGPGEHAMRARITSLSLSRTLLSWSDIAAVASNFPHTATLAAAANEMASIGPESLPAGVEEFDLSENAFTALSDLAPLSRLTRLRSLSLKYNPICRTRHDSDIHTSTILSNTITDIDLAHNAIATWSLFDQIAEAYPALRHVRVAGNPLFKDLRSSEGKALTTEDGYMFVVARLPQLETLNFSKITEKERLNAENYYLREIAAELAVASEDQATEVVARHARWKGLCDEYGEPTINRAPKLDELDPRSLAARLVNITFTLADAPCLQHVGRSWQQPVPKSFNIYALLGMVGKKLRVSPLTLRLIWETGENDPAAGDDGEGGVEWWDSDDEDEEEEEEGGGVATDHGTKLVARDVELVAGTRALGTYIEGREARIRVESR